MTDTQTPDDIPEQDAVENMGEPCDTQDDATEPDVVFDDLPPSEQVEILQQKLADASNDVLRAVADVQNMRKRTDEEIAKERKYGCATLARDMFGVADNLRMALMSISEDDKNTIPALKNLSFGLDMVAHALQDAFKKNGITEIVPAVGDDFDHNQHQAMGEVETDDVEMGKIAVVLSAGYMLYDRLLKPAMVNVAKPVSENETQSDV